MSKVFVSFNYNDSDQKSTVDNWKNQGLGTDISFTSEDGKNHLAKGDEHVKQILREHIDKSDKVLVLVGNNTHQRPWVDYEVNYAKSKGKPVLWTQIPDTNGAPPIQVRNSEKIPFKLNAIQKALREA